MYRKLISIFPGVWTLIFGAIIGVEKFTARKLLGVVASLIGIILISRVDLSKPDADTAPPAVSGREGSFPHKTSGEIALGDAMAAFSSIMYGVYTIVMKKQVGDESRVNMQLFFGLVGLFNLVLLWPGFFILHWLGIETFELPSTDRVWTIILVWTSSSLWFWIFEVLLADFSTISGQLSVLFYLGHCLGIRHAPDNSSCCDCWSEFNDPAVLGRANHSPGTIRFPIILGRGHYCVPVIFGRQPREQGPRRGRWSCAGDVIRRI